MIKKSGWWLVPIFFVSALLVNSCNPVTPLPTPFPPSPTAAPTGTAPPTDSVPVNRVPAIKNISLVTGSVVKIAPDPSNSAILRLTLNVATTSHVEPYPSFTDDKVGLEIEIVIDSTLAEKVAPGNSVQVKVTYRGDEKGGTFFGSELTILPE